MLKYLPVILFLVLFSCKENKKLMPVGVQFYYWKTNYTKSNVNWPSQAETPYIRIFDVAWNKEKKKAFPVAPIRVDTLPVKWIPVVYIKIEVIQQLDTVGLDSLCADIIQYMQSLIPYNGWSRLQIDCDWTASTKDKYFYFLQRIQQTLGKEISCTIRLHQISNSKNMGIPPVMHGVLMCYNMTIPYKENVANSIFELDILKRHTKKINQYPIHLDLAFPLYSWAVVFRNNQYYTLINEVRVDQLLNENVEKEGKRNWYKITRPTRINGFNLLENDRIRLEELSEEEVDTGIQYLLTQMREPTKLIWFHFDEKLINQHQELINSYYSEKEQ